MMAFRSDEPPRTGRFWFDLLAATAAIFISVVSLAVAFRGEQTQRGLLAANSWPFVQLSQDQDTGDTKLDVENAGVGPAKIMTFEMFYQGKPVDNPVDLLSQCCGLAKAASGAKPPPVAGLAYGQIYGNVLRPGEHVVAFGLKKVGPSAEILTKLNAALPDMSYRSCYCSVLQECWTSDLRSLAQHPVSSCPAAEHPFAMGG